MSKTLETPALDRCEWPASWSDHISYGEESLISFGWKAGWASYRLWMWWWREKSQQPYWESNPGHPV